MRCEQLAGIVARHLRVVRCGHPYAQSLRRSIRSKLIQTSLLSRSRTPSERTMIAWSEGAQAPGRGTAPLVGLATIHASLLTLSSVFDFARIRLRLLTER